APAGRRGAHLREVLPGELARGRPRGRAGADGLPRDRRGSRGPDLGGEPAGRGRGLPREPAAGREAARGAARRGLAGPNRGSPLRWVREGVGGRTEIKEGAMSREDPIEVWMATAGLGAVALGIALVPLRAVTSASNLAFVFLAFTVVVAELGGRGPALLAAVVSAMSLDFFLTEPYLRLT